MIGWFEDLWQQWGSKKGWNRILNAIVCQAGLTKINKPKN